MLSRWRKEYLEGKGRKRVERLMREASLMGRVAKLYRRVPGVERFYQRHKNLRLNMPVQTEINQQWVADLTYIKVNRQWRYLTVMLDV
jgi:putative transposase